MGTVYRYRPLFEAAPLVDPKRCQASVLLKYSYFGESNQCSRTAVTFDEKQRGWCKQHWKQKTEQ